MRFLLSYFKFAAFSSRSIFSVIVSEYRHRSVKPSWCFDKELWHMAHMNTLAHRHGELLSLSVSAKAVHPPTPPWQWMSYCWCSVCVCVPGAPLPGRSARRWSVVCRRMLPHPGALRSATRLRSSPNVPNLLLCPPVSAWRTQTHTRKHRRRCSPVSRSTTLR